MPHACPETGGGYTKNNVFIGELAAAAATVDKIRVRPIVKTVGRTLFLFFDKHFI